MANYRGGKLMAIGQFMPFITLEPSPFFETSFEQTLTNNSGTSYSNRLIRVLIGSARLAVSGKRVRLRFSPKTSGSNNVLESVYIGRRATTGNAYNFDPTTITQLLFDGGATANLNVGSPPVWSDAALFDFDNTQDVIVSIGYSSATQQALTVSGAASCTTYFKENARTEAGNAVLGGSVTSSANAVITVDRIEASKW